MAALYEYTITYNVAQFIVLWIYETFYRGVALDVVGSMAVPLERVSPGHSFLGAIVPRTLVPRKECLL